MDSDNLEEYPFYRELVLAFAGILSENGIEPKKNDEGGIAFRKELTLEQQYDYDLYLIYRRIRKSVKQISTILRLLDIEPSVYLTNKAKVKYDEYLEYNLENYFLRITSILDQSVRLVCDFYNLGIPAKSTSLRSLRENKHTKDKEATKQLVKFDKALQKIKQIRNRIAHHGGVNDRDFPKIEAHLYFLSMLNEKAPMDDTLVENLNQTVEELVEKKIRAVKEGLIVVKNFLILLDQALMKDYVKE